MVCRRSSRQCIARLIRLRSTLHPPPGSGNFASMIPRPENCFAVIVAYSRTVNSTPNATHASWQPSGRKGALIHRRDGPARRAQRSPGSRQGCFNSAVRTWHRNALPVAKLICIKFDLFAAMFAEANNQVRALDRWRVVTQNKLQNRHHRPDQSKFRAVPHRCSGRQCRALPVRP